MMSETEIKPSCVGIGQKLISLDRKVSTTMVKHFLLCDLGFYGFVLKPIHGYSNTTTGLIQDFQNCDRSSFHDPLIFLVHCGNPMDYCNHQRVVCAHLSGFW